MHRINFRISKELLENFHEASLKAGIPKSYLLRDWINEVSIDDLYSVRTQKQGDSMTSYNFFIEKKFKEEIELRSITMGIEVSEFLRRVLKKNLDTFGNINQSSHIDKVYNFNYLNRLWENGDYSNYLDICEENIPTLSYQSLSNYANIVAQFKDISRLLILREKLSKFSLLDSETIKLIFNIDLNIINHKILYLTDDLTGIENELNDLISQLSLLPANYKEVLGYARYLYGQLLYNQEKHDEALSNSISALELYDIYNNPFEIGLIYLKIRNIFIHKMQFDLADIYLNKAERIFQSMGNKYMMDCLNVVRSKFYYAKGDINNAEMELNKVDNINKVFTTELHEFDIYESRGRIEIMKGNYIEASKDFDKATHFVSDFDNSRKNIPKVYKIYIKSKNDFKGAILEMEKFNSTKEPNVKSSFYQYMNGAILYLNVQSQKYKQEGENKLKELLHNYNKPFALQAAKSTLENKVLYTFR